MKLRSEPYISILFTLPLWFIALITNSVLIADIAAIFGLFVSLNWLWKRLGNQLEMIRLLRIGSMILIALQNGAWLTSSFIFRIGLDDSILSGFTIIGTSFSFYCLAIIYIVLFSAFLAFLGSSKQLYNSEKNIQNLIIRIKDVKLVKIQILLLSIALINIGLIATGIIGIKTTNVEGFSEGKIPAWLALYRSVLPVQIVFCSLFWVKIKDHAFTLKKLYRFAILIISFIPVLLIYFSEGRRMFIFALVCLAYWIIFFLRRKPDLKKTIIIVVFILIPISQLLTFANALRHYDLSKPNTDASIVEIFVAGWTFYRSGDNQESAENKIIKNLSTRPLVANPLARSIELSTNNKSFLLGKNIINSLIWTIPGPLFPSKRDYLVQEDLLYKHFPIGSKDTADSVYLYSYVDFGWFGIIFYPIFVFVIWYSVLKLSAHYSFKSTISLIIISILFQLIVLSIGEGSLITWFSAVRSVIAWLLLGIIYKLASTFILNKNYLLQS